MTDMAVIPETEGDGVERHHHPAAVYLRGVAMGAADVVPGVSGGTIAFISGIYFRLLAAISAVPVAVFRHLLRGRPGAFWTAIDGTFLVALLAGILTSIVSLASAITYGLAEYPVLVWSFFLGLILASIWHVGRQIRWRGGLALPLLAGIAAAWWVTTMAASQVAPSPLVFFGAGALAICAMILPGISGSFILLMIGMYGPVLDAVKSADLAILVLFASGCLVGLLSIARLITWAFRHFHDAVMALLTGFMIGALNKVWPWKEVLTWRTNHAGEQVPLTELNVWPGAFEQVTGHSPEIGLALLMMLLGLGLVLAIEWLGQRKSVT